MIQQSNKIQQTYEANGQDYFNFAACYGTSNVQIQAVIELDNHLDSELLEQAVRLSVDAEPILGCHFVENDKQAYWQRFINIDEILWYTYEESEDINEAVKNFLKRPLGLEGQQQIEVKLIRCNKGDTVCVKVNHACSDAAGVKQYLVLLSDLYTRLNHDLDYKPLPTEGKRDAKNYFDALGIDEPMTLFDPKGTQKEPTWAFPYHGLELYEMNIALCRFSPEDFKTLKAFAKEKKVTINTMILTAYFRSMFNMIAPLPGEEMEIYVTIDLRKFISNNKKQAICNLSSMMKARLARVCEETFEDTLTRVSQMIRSLKNNNPGLVQAVVFEALGKIDYSQSLKILQGFRQKAIETKKSSPLLSNIGVLPTFTFGHIEANNAYIVTPTMYAPGFMLGVSTYNNQGTLVVSYYEPSTNTQEVETLLNTMKKELLACTS
jgi:NRPS condensation-like uncharacterized protein